MGACSGRIEDKWVKDGEQRHLCRFEKGITLTQSLSNLFSRP